MSSPDPRGFDWGPPGSGSWEPLKEWVVPFLLLVLILGGGYLVIGDASERPAIREGSQKTDGSEDCKTVSGSGGIAQTTSGQLAQMGTNAISEGPGQEGKLSGSLPQPEFFVQLGAFADEPSAQDAQIRLRKNGFTATLKTPDEQYEMFRLVLGPFTQESQAGDTARQLNELDFPCFVIESP